MTRHEIDDLLAARKKAKDDREYATADVIRRLLAENGVAVVDTRDGQVADGGTEYYISWLQSKLSLREDEITRLRVELKTMGNREHYHSGRIVDLVRKNLLLQFGHGK